MTKSHAGPPFCTGLPRVIDVLGDLSNHLIESGTVGAIGIAWTAFRRGRIGLVLIVTTGAAA
ncbi:MAG: hypothetical protein ACREPS_08395 [Rhodanobacteraceae bacterium]